MFSDKIEHVETIDQMSTEELIELLRDVVTNGGLDLEELLGYTGTGTGINSQYFGYKRA